MKKVRFESPNKVFLNRMEESECHSPRPFMEKGVATEDFAFSNYQRLISCCNEDPVKGFESSNSSPYPMVNKMLSEACPEVDNWMPSNELDLSLLDASNCRYKSNFTTPLDNRAVNDELHTQVLSSIENKMTTPPNILNKGNDFFIKRGNLEKYQLSPVHSQFNRLSLGKENKSITKETEFLKSRISDISQVNSPENNMAMAINKSCRCHHCDTIVRIVPHNLQYLRNNTNSCRCTSFKSKVCSDCYYNSTPKLNSSEYLCCNCKPHIRRTCSCDDQEMQPLQPQNAVDKKILAVEKFEQSTSSCKDIEKQTNISKEKREPTVADLFKIIKLQNEQLQLLQEKVDKFISANQTTVHSVQPLPVQNNANERVAHETIDSEISQEHKISIGVMTSFEMVRTSTVINKEIVTQTKENAQIQCNRSQISITEVISKAQPVNLNFLDGIIPTGKTTQTKIKDQNDELLKTGISSAFQHTENVNDEKTLNEVSLYNVQVDNATTPQISPEQSLYLDVRDYSDSDSNSDDQSNVGWTYYNKVMTHVNGLLHDSDMPSSASALYRNTRQQCVQMQIDKTNLSVTKRVKFGDDPLGLHQPHIYAPSTDTSIKMNQLASKYLKKPDSSSLQQLKQTRPVEMSFATRNYMEKHKLLPGVTRTPSPHAADIPRFLDITALKRQPKLL